MKINPTKISKMQTGGYLTYRPLTMPPEVIPEEDEPSAADIKKAQKADAGVPLGIDDKSMQKLLGNGITNDVMAFSQTMSKVELEYQNLSDSEKEGPKGRHLRSLLKGNFAELNALIRSKDLFTAAMTKASANGGLEEFAVVPGAFIVKKEDGTLDKVSFSQFAKDRNSGTLAYKPLTNAELAKEREYNKNLTGNSAVFSILEYSKGIEQVQKEVLTIATGLGKISQSTSTGAYDEGTIEAIREATVAAKQGMFKVKETQSMSTNKPQIEKAKQAMWSTLSDNSKNVLRARAAFLEEDPSKLEQRAALLAMDLLDSRLDQSQNSVSDMMATKGSGSGSGGSGDALTNMGEREAAELGKSQVESLSLLSDLGVNIQSRMYTVPLKDVTREKDGMNLKVSVANSGLAEWGFVNRASTLDGQKIDPNNTIFTGEAFYTRLPVIKLANGAFVLDEEGAKRLAQANEEIEKLPEGQRKEYNKETIRQKYNVHKLTIEKVFIAEAASYDTQYRMLGLLGKRDGKYFKEADKATKQLLGQTVDPEEEGIRYGLDYKAYKHAIIIPAKGNGRFADGNSLLMPKSGVDTTNEKRGNSYSSVDFRGSAFYNAGKPDFSVEAINK